MSEQLTATVQGSVHCETLEKQPSEAQHMEKPVTDDNPVYDEVDEEPEIHMRTWIALASMFLLNLVQVFALQGPPAVVGRPVWSVLHC